MSTLGQKRTLQDVNEMSALPPEADILHCGRYVRFGPKADIGACVGRNVTARLHSKSD
jgi:hypothetical protein